MNDGVDRLPDHLVAQVEDARTLQELGLSIVRVVDSRINA